MITIKRLCVGLAIIGFGYGFGVQYTIAAENVALGNDTRYSVKNLSTKIQSTGDSQSQEMLKLSNRIDEVERKVDSIIYRLERTMVSNTLLRETKELATDAWDLAVEARTIAIRAEAKADKAQK